MSLTGFWNARVWSALAGLALLLGVLVALAPGPLISIRPVNPETGKVVLNSPQDVNAAGTNQKFAPGSFDASQYVVSIWQSKISPWAEKHAVNLDKLLSTLADERKQAELRYGVASGGDTYNFLVHGRARVASIDTSTPVGKIKLTNPGWKTHDITLYAGPLVFGTALRDAFPFLQLNDFTNQMQYASVAKAMNTRAIKQAYNGLQVEQLENRTIQFTGAFAESPDGSITIVPIDIGS